MITRTLRPAGGLLLLSLAAIPASAQTGKFDLEKTKTVLTGMIRQAIDERGVPSISIALVRGDSIVWKAAFGYANVRMKVPATTETIYSTGSTFKSATATAIMQLVEQGKLSLDHPVNRYLGESRVQDRLQAEKPVTFTHILSHWSGLTAGAVTKPIWGRELPKSLDEMVSQLYSVRPPETKWEYNNFAYGMAGLLVEKISGVEYEKYMVDNILAPLGITIKTPVRPSPEMVEMMALPYLPQPGGKPIPVEQVHFDVYPAGDVYLTAEDMARFLAMHLNGGVFRGKRILSEASVKQMQEPRFGGNYGFGFGIRKAPNGHTLISHSGGIPGQSSMMMGDVDSKVGVYFMSNSGAPPAIAEAAIKLLNGEDYTPPAPPKPVTVDNKTLDRYVGRYTVDGQTITLKREGNNLVMPAPDGGPSMTLLPESETRFFIRGQDLKITFVSGPDGKVTKMVVDTGSGTMEAVRQN